ncbi:unnamed protein product [marine sediment metagenome]|uniref:Uncharacterized protein n=1 Tax=marine sediment metagenome TaxID=412755 RepID=X0REI5_9ZZZZ
MNQVTKNKCPAIPPQDYKGTMADWFIALEERGYDAENYCYVMLDDNEYNEILDWCERGE